MTTEIDLSKIENLLKIDLESQIRESEYLLEMNKKPSVNKYNSRLWIKYFENDIKINKLTLLRGSIYDTITKKLDDMIRAKKKQCLFDRMEILQELVDADEMNEHLYLELSNDLKEMFMRNEKGYFSRA